MRETIRKSPVSVVSNEVKTGSADANTKKYFTINSATFSLYDKLPLTLVKNLRIWVMSKHTTYKCVKYCVCRDLHSTNDFVDLGKRNSKETGYRMRKRGTILK
jgi:hypothetical protein